MSYRGSEIASLFKPDPNAENLSPSEIAQALIHREKAGESLIHYAQFIDPTYVAYPVHRYIASKLEDVEQGLIRRLAIFVPPAIGKSRLASELFPSWYFGRNPTLEFIQTSYDADLAYGFGRIVRNIVNEPRYKLLFPEVSIAEDAKAMNEWHTTLKGEYKAEGVGGGLIGFHANILNVDDPFKNYEAAASPNERRKVWDWYTSTVLNRLRSYKDGPGSVICIMQRWHDDDLGGRIEKLADSGEEDWEIIRIPSIAEEDDLLERSVGEALLPEGPNQRTIEELEVIRSHNPPRFMALHQQKPVRDEGELFNPAWFQTFVRNETPKGLTHYLASDYAFSEGKGDYTVHIIFGVDGEGHVWILDLFREQCDIMKGVEKAVEWMLKYEPLKCFLERVQMNKVVAPVLQKCMREEGAFAVLDSVSVIGKGSKDSEYRAGSIAGAMQMGYVHIPEQASWRGDLEWELSRFPNGRNDDQVDALSLIGMRLANLLGLTHKEPTANAPLVINPVARSFDEILLRAAKKRKGRFLRPDATVVPYVKFALVEA